MFLADRIACMTDGPEAEVGDILPVNFPRPRERKAVMEHPDYYKLREQLIEFLEVHAHKKKKTGPAEVNHGGPAGMPAHVRPLMAPEAGRILLTAA